MERKVKGTLVKLIIKGIRSDKINNNKYDEILSNEAKLLLGKRILDSVWYPYKAYKECYEALGNIFAKNNQNVMIEWGREFGQAVMSTIYKNIIAEGNIDKLVDKYQRFHRLLFNFGNLIMEKISSNEVIVTYSDFDHKFEFWIYTSVGWMQKSIEMCLKKKVNYEFLKKAWKGDDMTQYKLTWIP